MLLFRTTFVVILLSLLLIAGCSSKHDIKVTEVFRSQIGSDDAKLFTFSIIFVGNPASKIAANDDKNLAEKPTKSRQNKGRGKKNNTDNNPKKQRSDKKEKRQDRMNSELERRLAEKLADNNYCRKGFFELERSLNKTIFTIRGECNDSATAADRQNFP